MTRVSVILPVYHQADHIGEVVGEYLRALASLDCMIEMLLVSNGSCAETRQACAALAVEHAPVDHLDSEPGWGRAVRAGLERATGQLLCYTNTARTTADDLAMIVLYALNHQDHVIKANRKIRENVLRRLGSLIYNLQCRMLFDLPYWDINGTPKVFPREMEQLLTLTRDDDLIDVEFNAICRKAGYRMLEVPILSSRRRGGTSTMSLMRAWRLYTGVYQLKRNLG